MVTVKIFLRKHDENAKSGFVWIRFYVNREKVSFSTGVKCETINWNSKKSCIGPGDINASDKNLIIEKVSGRVTDVFVKYRLHQLKISK